MQTPLKKVRGLGAAREGTGHFWRIRLSSLALVPLSLFMIGWALSLRGAGYHQVREALAQPFIALAALLFILISLDHMRLGMQIIIEDYVHGEGGKLTLLILNTFFCAVLGAVAVFSILKIAFGG